MSNIELIHGDCFEEIKNIADSSVDLVLEDPPYNTTQNKWDVKIDFIEFWKERVRVGKKNCPFIFTAAQPFATDLINSNRDMFRYDLIWYKPLGSGFLNANRMPMRNHEHILVFYKSLPTYNPIKYVGKMRSKGRRGGETSENYGKYNGSMSENNEYHPQSVVEFTNGDKTKNIGHPTEKPLDLMRYLIKTYSNEGDVVFDGFMGSGTTAAACVLEKRKCISIEKENKYFEMSNKRVSQLLTQATLF